MADAKREAVFWSTREDDEILRHDSAEEAIEDVLGWYAKEADAVAYFGETIKVYGFARMDPTPVRDSIVAHCMPLESVLEALNEQFGDPDGYRKPTPKMLEAHRMFVDAVVAEYKVFARMSLEPYRKRLLLFGTGLRQILGELDEDLGDPEGDSLITEKMLEAHRVFVDAVVAEYKVFAFEVVETREVNVAEWWRVNRRVG